MVRLEDSSVALNVMAYGDANPNLRELVVLNSIDFPMPPSKRFCDTMRVAGYRVIYVERPGFGNSQGLPRPLLTNHLIDTGVAVTSEAAIIHTLLEQLQLTNFVLLCMGSSNPVGYRLTKLNQKIAFTVFSNAMFNQDTLDVFRPMWFQHALRRALRSQTGMRFSISGTKYAMKRAPSLFYRQVLQKCAGDVKYFEANGSDFSEASRIYCAMDPSVIAYDVRTSMLHDKMLRDNLFKDDNCIAFTSHEVDEKWKRGLEQESKRLSLPITFASEGDFFAPYVCPDHLLSIIKQFT